MIPSKPLITAYNCDFDKLFGAFQHTANMLVAPETYNIDKDNQQQIELILRYFIGDETVREHGICLHKGLMLCGTVGAGKTSIMEIMQLLCTKYFNENRFQTVRARDLVLSYERKGALGIEKYLWNTENSRYGNRNPFAVCIDDIGIGNENAHYYGNQLNVIAELLLGRYAVFKNFQYKRLTHITTNLNAEKIEELYGNRVRSRFREMFNVITFVGEDRRK